MLFQVFKVGVAVTASALLDFRAAMHEANLAILDALEGAGIRLASPLVDARVETRDGVEKPRLARSASERVVWDEPRSP